MTVSAAKLIAASIPILERAFLKFVDKSPNLFVLFGGGVGFEGRVEFVEGMALSFIHFWKEVDTSPVPSHDLRNFFKLLSDSFNFSTHFSILSLFCDL